MTVYVDDARNRLGFMVMCHMMADDIDELHQMADAIGVARRHFQGHGQYPHYDICMSKRREAVFNGAVEITARNMVRWWRAKRIGGGFDPFDQGSLLDERPS